LTASTGRARAGWYASVKGLSPGIAGRKNWAARVKTDNPGAISKGKKEGSFTNKLAGFNKYVELINGVNYIVFLEYGSSMIAPAGMVRISIKKMQNQLPALMSDEFVAEWNSSGF